MSKSLLPVGLGRSSRWEEVSKKNMVGLRLLCPNGMAGEIEASESFKFFQLKVGSQDVGAGFSAVGQTKRTIQAHIIGVVTDTDGSCLCRAWEYPVYGTETTSLCWKCNRLTKTEFCECGQDLRGIAPVDKARLKKIDKRVCVKQGELLLFKDNISNMKYRNLGKLSLNVQGLRI
jgi:hypothetical protein